VGIGSGGWVESGRDCPKPGRKKVAGETLPEALIPLQPAPDSKAKAGMIANRRNFQFNLTWRV
jgi:hypothetical protein